ncbi:MAG TPA: hemerythrin domain-containing protein [Polyangiaceae bacterium]|nr:hemerythrin domain-containing protein [Polyangiaceae bacterium]
MNRKTNVKSAPKPSVGRVLGAAVELVKLTLTESKGASAKSATSLLTQQHDEVKALFKRIEGASSRAAKVKLFEELAHNLVAHDAIEREIFYPACERALGMTDLLGEALVEHGVVEFCLYQADQAGKSADFGFKCQVLKEVVLHHVKEEEGDFFPKVERALSKPELERLGARMKARFDQAKAADFRAPLHQNLKQVLAGALKPEKPRPKSNKKPRAGQPRSSKQRKAA